MNKRSRIILYIAVPAATALLIVIAGFMPVSHPSLTRAAEHQLQRQLRMKTEFSGLRLTLFTGIEIDSMRLTGSLPHCEWVRVLVPRAVFSINPYALFAGRLSTPHVALHNPHAEISLTPGKTAHATRYGAPLMRIHCAAFFSIRSVFESIRTVKMFHGSCRIEREEQEIFACGDARGRTRIRRGEHPIVKGYISADSGLLAAKIPVTGLRAEGTFEKEILVLSRGSGKLLNGNAEFSGRADSRSGAFSECRVRLKGIDCEQLYGSDAPGTLSGRLDAIFSGKGNAFDIERLSGKGTVTVRNVVARDLPIQRSILVRLLSRQLSNLSFDHIAGEYSIDDGKVATPSIRAEGPQLSFRSSGWISLAGTMNQNVSLYPRPPFMNKLAPAIRNALLTDTEGRPYLRARAWGPVRDPRVSIDRQIQKRAVNEAVKSVIDGIKGLFD